MQQIIHDEPRYLIEKRLVKSMEFQWPGKLEWIDLLVLYYDIS